MKHIIESIIGRKSSGVGYKLSNPKLKDLQHLDVVKCANGNIYICIDPVMLRGRIARINNFNITDNFNAYRISDGRISSLGLTNFNPNLTCKTYSDYDIVAVYRDIFVNKDYPNFQTIWDILQEKIKFIV